MVNKTIKIALIGKTNVGKSTLINKFVGEKISISNKKINTTQDLILGIKNISSTQIIFYDTPGSSLIKKTHNNSKFNKSIFWEAINLSDIIIYLIDSSKYNYNYIQSELKIINESGKFIILVFNKIDLIDNKIILKFIKELSSLKFIKEFFHISAKKNLNIKILVDFILSKAKKGKWLFKSQIISNKDDIFISSECTRNAILKYLHQEIPYNVKIKNINFKILKNKHIKIKQSIELKNFRHKPFILGKNGEIIKKIRQTSQKEISDILKSKVHLYLQVNKYNDN